MFLFCSFFSLTGHKGNGSWRAPILFSLPAVEKAQLEKSPVILTFSRSKRFTEVSEASQWGVDFHFVGRHQEPSMKKAQG